MAFSIEASEKRILPQRTAYVYIDPRRAELGFGNRQSDARINYQVISANSTFEHLEKEFFGNFTGEPSETPQFVKFTGKESSRGVMIGPPAGYFQLNGLVVATPYSKPNKEELEERQQEIVPAISPRQLDKLLRFKYTAAKLAGLQTAYYLATDQQLPIVMESICPAVSSLVVNYPKSIPLPHATFGLIDLSSFSSEASKSHHLQAEQDSMDPEYLSLMAKFIYTYIHSALRDSEFESNEFEVRPRAVEPFGYDVSLDLPVDQLTAQAKFVSVIFDAHHDGSAKFSQSSNRSPRIAGSNGAVYLRKPQPARREIMRIGSNGLILTGVPIEYSYAGVYEACGATLLRSPDFDMLHSPEEVEIFRRTSAENIRKVTNGVLIL